MIETQLTAAEAELYDRQIRLWGIESQEKLRAANVLLIGVRGLGSEIAKNILLSGINSLTILDDGTVTEEELQKNFLLSHDTLGGKVAEAVLPKAQALNPLVKITADVDPVSKKSDDYFMKYTIIVATRLQSPQLVHVDTICRKKKVQFICGDVFGMFGYTLADFQHHDYYEDQVKLPDVRKRTREGKPAPVITEKTTIKKAGKITYPAIEKALLKLKSEKKDIKPSPEGRRKRRNDLYYLMQLLLHFRDQTGRDPSYSNKDEDLGILQEIRSELLLKYQLNDDKIKEDVLHLVFGEVAPICAIVGGVIAQEVIKAVSHKEVPINNLFLLNPYTFGGKEETVGV